MPVLRYFLFVGTALLLLLFAVDAYLPKLPAAGNVSTAANMASDIAVIRIHSVQKWPERVEFDTSLPAVAPAAVVVAANNVPADTAAPVRMRDASRSCRQIRCKLLSCKRRNPKRPSRSCCPNAGLLRPRRLRRVVPASRSCWSRNSRASVYSRTRSGRPASTSAVGIKQQSGERSPRRLGFASSGYVRSRRTTKNCKRGRLADVRADRT